MAGTSEVFRIAQISDLHCGGPYFEVSLLERAISEINELQPDVVVCSGDLTTFGFRHEYLTAREYIDRLDSGQIGRGRYRWIEEQFSEEPADLRIFVLHHHLLPVPGTGRERNVVYDAGDVIECLQGAGVDLVLSGHKHVPYAWKLEEMFVVNTGTVSSLRLRGNTRPCYNVIEVAGSHVALRAGGGRCPPRRAGARAEGAVPARKPDPCAGNRLRGGGLLAAPA